MKNGTSRAARRGRGDEGVTIILFALAMVAILFIVAIVIDFGNVRSSRQGNKLSTDVAASAGLQSLAPDGTPNPWQGVCASLDYLEVNEPDLVPFTLTYQDGAGNAIGGNPCADAARLAQGCTPNTPTTWAWIRVVSGDRAFDIKSGYALPDPAFPEDTAEYAGDDGDLAQGGCDHLAVLTLRTDDAFFGGIAGRTSYDTVARTVGRVAVAAEALGNPAFLMLERTKCDTLSEQVGTSELGIIVDAADADNPGFIHVDSKGDPATGCNGNNNAGGWAVYGDDSTSPKIVAQATSSGIPGTISVHALQVGNPPTAYAASTAAGIEPDPTPGHIVSRKPIDNKYNSSGEPSITNLHSEAVQYVNGTTPPPATYPAARPGPWTVISGGGCNNSSAPAAAKVFVNCSSGFSAANPSTTFTNATDVVFNGPVSVANNRALYFPNARRIVVGGTSNGGLAVRGGGVLGVNSAAFTSATGPFAACAGREGPGWGQTTELVIFGGAGTGNDEGALNVTGDGALCQTFVYLAGPKSISTYTPRQITNGTYDPSCTASKPCALTTGNPISDAHLFVAGDLRWSAPNQLTVQPTPGSVGFEDLALWGETADLSELKSGGDLRARGVYFMPNDRMEFRSPASATPQDAQFISRSLALLQGTLRMQPTPSNVVLVPLLSGSGLVR